MTLRRLGRLSSARTVFETAWLSVIEKRYEWEGVPGSESDPYYVVKRDEFVLIVAECGPGKLLLVRQYRPGTDHHYVALPAGYMNEGENPEGAAARELMEETGFRAVNCKRIGELHPLPGYVDSKAHVVVCQAVPGGDELREIEEVDEVVVLQWSAVLKMIEDGRINEMQAVAALLLARHHGKKSAG